MFTRAQIPHGEWDADLDAHPESEYAFTHSGYTCKIVRNPMNFTYCGYVDLPRGHPDYHKRYSDIEDDIVVHGGLTYDNKRGRFGFDCHHVTGGDVSPVDAIMYNSFKDSHMASLFNPKRLSLSGRTHYWTYEEVVAQIKSMAEQFKAREK
jgi:hypothetical protein